MVYIVSKVGMKKGYWKIVDKQVSGERTVNSGLSSKKASEEIAHKMNVAEGYIDKDYIIKKHLSKKR
jgi:hypothetical protein